MTKFEENRIKTNGLVEILNKQDDRQIALIFMHVTGYCGGDAEFVEGFESAMKHKGLI